MKVYYLAGKQQVELRDEPLPVLGPRDILVKTAVSALSVGTEVWRYVNHGHYGGEGGLCGYNSVGQVVDVGTEVSRLQVGDQVFAAHPHAEYFAVSEDRAVKLAHDADLEASAFTYLPTLGLHALRYADYQAGDNVLVVGLGIVGLLAALVARTVGARVAALEVDGARCELAENLSFGPVLDPREATTAQHLDSFFGEPGPDVIVETSQAWGGLTDALRLARSATRLAIVGIYRYDPPPEVANELLRLSFMNRDHFHNQRLKFIGCSNDPVEDYPPGDVRWTIQRNMAYIAEKIYHGDLETRRAITHRFRWDELEQAYRRFVAGDRSMVGVILHWED
jgi:threonine dehydrogenase-like Zn-dependent dehydrogenase